MTTDITTTKYIGKRTNKAVEKLMEERHFGLAQEDPLVPIINTNRTSGQTFTGGAGRRSMVKFRDQITDEEAAAMDEIRIGHLYYTSSMGLKAMDYARTPGRGPSDVLPSYNDLMQRYNHWYKMASRSMPTSLSMCIDFCALGWSFAAIAKSSSKRVSDRAVKQYILTGLREYVSANRKPRLGT